MAFDGTIVKICGLMDAADLAAVNAALPDYVGFIATAGFRRSVGREFLEEAARTLDRRITRTGVFVDEPVETIVELAENGLIDAVQLHGSENDAYIAALRELMAKRGATRQVIKAFAVENARDLDEAARTSADLVLLDSGKGTGETFDWDLVERFPRPFMLAGGLGPGNVAEAIRRVRPYAVDMSSGVETEGRKDPAKIAAAVSAVRNGPATPGAPGPLAKGDRP